MVRRENQHMAHGRIVIGLTIALLSVVVTGCAGPTTKTGVVSTDPAASSSAAAGLSGTWHGFVYHPGADDTSPPGMMDLTLQVREDGTYTFTWGTRPARTGTVVARGKRVMLDDDATEPPINFWHSGNTLRGFAKDSRRSGRMVALGLEKVETGVGDGAAPAARQSTRSRLCERAGGVYAHDTCQPITVPDWRAACEARGGTYFDGGEYCEVPAGGLRPM
jgi:hypothetical protein